MKFTSPLKAIDLAISIGAELIGDGQLLLTGINEIHNVQEGDISFVDHPKYYDFTLKSAATCILINTRREAPAGKVLLYCENPFEVYNTLTRKYRPDFKPEDLEGRQAEAGEGTVIFPGVYLGRNVTIGHRCKIYPNVVIYDYTQIGDGVTIHANTTIGGDAFYYKWQETHYDKMHTAGRVVIHDDVEIGAGCTIDAGVSSDTVIGRGTKIDDQVHIGHDVQIGEHCIIAAQVGIAGNTKVGNHVKLYGQVGVGQNLSIGDHATVLATSAVSRSIAPGKTMLGIPAEEAKHMARQFAVLKALPGMWDKLRHL